MPALSNAVLFGKLRAALPKSVTIESAGDAIHPIVFRVPGFVRTRAYLFTVTPDRSTPGARPPGEFKIQLIIDGQTRPARGALDLRDAFVALLGYSPDYGVFVGWESRHYSTFSYSANVQVREHLLQEARNTGWAVARPRRLKGTEEVRVALSAGNLMHYLRCSREADYRNLIGTWREAYFLSRSPNYSANEVPRHGRAIAEYVEKERERLTSTRLSRDARFSPRVKEQFEYSCALCGVQLEIVEAAHIIPASDVKGRDELWNGLALCPSHHTLFDARRFAIGPDLDVRIDSAAIEFLEESGRSSGIELLTEFDGRSMRRPLFWDASSSLRGRMQEALTYSCSLANLG